MQKWEYKVIKGSSTNEDELNRLGQEGWELVTAALGADSSFRLYLKRPTP